MTRMRYDIRLKITQDYPGMVGIGRHLIRVQPADLPGRQSVLSRQVLVTPNPSEYAYHKDFFGNPGTMIGHFQPHSRMEISMRARVECQTPAEALDMSPTLAALPDEIAQVNSLGPAAPHHFLGHSARIVKNADIEEYVRACLEPDMTLRDIVETVGRALHKDMTFESGATTVDTPAAEAFADRRGVCQDYTHIMITGLRALGIPTGYVSGFLRTEPPEGQPRLEGADAMHAWVRAWCGIEHGWIEYDPTNATHAKQDHIVVAYGRDYDDISPVRGVLRTSGTSIGTQAVDVIPISAHARDTATR